MNEPTGDQVTSAVAGRARKELADAAGTIKHCLGQLTNEQVWWRPQDSMNSIANLILHVCGNMRQWIVAGIGGAADVRDRPLEFADRSGMPKDELVAHLDQTLQAVDEAVAALGPAVLPERRRIQGVDVTVLGALFHSMTHFVGHTFQIVYITRLQLGEAYRFAWTPTTSEQQASGRSAN